MQVKHLYCQTVEGNETDLRHFLRLRPPRMPRKQPLRQGLQPQRRAG